MKKILKKLLITVLVIVLIASIAMFIIGKAYHFEKSILINAQSEEVYKYVNSSKKFNKWNPWLKLDPHIKIVYSGTEGDVGDQYCWEGNDDVGAGCHEILELMPNQMTKTKMIFKKPFESIGYSNVMLKPEGDKTKVIWTLDCDLDYPMNLMKPMMDYNMDDSYANGLKKLKELVEKRNN